MADLYDTTKQNISLHIKNIFDEEKLDINSVKEFLTVQKEGNRKVERKVKYYNLDMIISLGYRIKSKVATNFRRWATERLKEYMIKGFTMDDERLKGNGGGNYWKELLTSLCCHGHTAPEVIYERANSDKPFMGLTTFKGDLPVMSAVILSSTGEKLLVGAGAISHNKAISNKIDDKAKSE